MNGSASVHRKDAIPPVLRTIYPDTYRCRWWDAPNGHDSSLSWGKGKKEDLLHVKQLERSEYARTEDQSKSSVWSPSKRSQSGYPDHQTIFIDFQRESL